MSESTRERILYPEDEPTASAENVRTSLNSSLDEIVGQACKGLDVNDWTEKSVDRLKNLFQILSDGLNPEVESKYWVAFINHLSGETQRFGSLIEALSAKGETIGNLVNRYGLSIRSNLIVNQLLTEEALEKLQDIKQPE